MKTILYCFIFLLGLLELKANADLTFEFDCTTAFNQIVYSQAYLILPNGEILKLYADRMKMYEYTKKDYFSLKGKYILYVSMSSNNFGFDYIDYPFELNGEEIEVNIRIKIDTKENFVEREKKKEKKSGWIMIHKYYKTDKNLLIKLTNMKPEYYDDPVFLLENKTKDTIYGDIHPEYFWGSLSVLNKNSKWEDLGRGHIDFCVSDKPLLLPDSTKYATVGEGAAGDNRTLPKNKYKFILLYTKNKYIGFGLQKYYENKHTIWYAATKEYNKLIYEFEIK